MIQPDKNEFLTVMNICDERNYSSPSVLEDPDRNGDQIEKTIIYKDLYKSLSDEAKSVVRTILYSPQEIIDLWCNTNGNNNGYVINKRKTRKYIRFNFKSSYRLIVNELEGFVRNIIS